MLTNEYSMKNSAAIAMYCSQNDSKHFIHQQEPQRLQSSQTNATEERDAD